VVAPLGGKLSADGGSFTVLAPAQTGFGGAGAVPTGDTPAAPDGSAAEGNDTGASADVGGVGSAEGTAGPNACVANISLASAPGQGVSRAGIGDIDVGSTALSAALFMLLGASMASVFRRKRSQAVNA
jgi:hypothetical protein